MYATYLRLDITVHDEWRSVVRAASSKLTRSVRFDPARRKDRHRFYRRMLAHHRRAQRLVRAWRL
jgi:hypothetical protein